MILFIYYRGIIWTKQTHNRFIIKLESRDVGDKAGEKGDFKLMAVRSFINFLQLYSDILKRLRIIMLENSGQKNTVVRDKRTLLGRSISRIMVTMNVVMMTRIILILIII